MYSKVPIYAMEYNREFSDIWSVAVLAFRNILVVIVIDIYFYES